MTIATSDGQRFTAAHDAGIADSDLARQGEKLERKFDALVVPLLGAKSAELRDMLSTFGESGSVADVMGRARSLNS